MCFINLLGKDVVQSWGLHKLSAQMQDFKMSHLFTLSKVRAGSGYGMLSFINLTCFRKPTNSQESDLFKAFCFVKSILAGG